MRKFYLFLLMIFVAGIVNAQTDKSLEKKTSIREITELNVVTFPNPASLNQKITIKSSIPMLRIEILNIIGTRILNFESRNQSDEITLLLNNCEAGLYLVKVVLNNDKTVIKKLMIK